MALTCLHAWQHLSMLLMRWLIVSWGISSQIWTRSSLSSWTVWGSTWQCQMDESTRSVVWEMLGPVSGIISFILQKMPAYSCHMSLGIVMHQEEPKAHCTNAGSDNEPSHAEQCHRQHNVFHSFSRPLHICHMCLGWHRWTCQLGSRVPESEHRAHQRMSRSQANLHKICFWLSGKRHS